MKYIGSIDIFDDSFNNDTGESKPVMRVNVDGGPDENPRYTKTIECAIDYFTSQDLNAFFLAKKVTGRSAFNRIEHRMAKFSQELSGIVMPHSKFGSHLNLKGGTIDLKRKEKFHGGWILAEIWLGIIIDCQPVLMEYINEEKEEDHIRESQLSL